MAYEDVENALRAWVKTTSGLDDAHVFWADQHVEYPSGPFITLRITGTTQVGELSDVQTIYHSDGAPGQEIEKRVVDTEELTLSIQVWGAPVVSSSGKPSAVALAAQVRTGLSLPSVRQALDDAGMSVHDTGSVQNLGTLLDTEFEGRAQFDAKAYYALTASEFTGYISSIDLVTDFGGTMHVAE